MHIQWLVTFTEVVRQESVTGAARSLGYTQSAVSRQIGALEQEWGARLLERRPRGVTPTEHGRVLFEHAVAILRRCAEARRDLTRLDAGTAGRIRIGAFPTAVAALVPGAIAAFRRDRPEVTVSLVEATTPTLLDHLATGEVDVAVLSASPDQPIADTRARLAHLLDERLLVAVSTGHRLAHRRTVRLAELAADPFITGSAADENALLRARLPVGFDPIVDIVVADWTGKLGCVAAGLGVALLPALAISAAPPDVRLLRLHRADAPVRRIFVASPADRVPSATSMAFGRELQAAATRLNRALSDAGAS